MMSKSRAQIARSPREANTSTSVGEYGNPSRAMAYLKLFRDHLDVFGRDGEKARHRDRPDVFRKARQGAPRADPPATEQLKAQRNKPARKSAPSKKKKTLINHPKMIKQVLKRIKQSTSASPNWTPRSADFLLTIPTAASSVPSVRALLNNKRMRRWVRLLNSILRQSPALGSGRAC